MPDRWWLVQVKEGGNTGEFPHLEQQRLSPCDRNHMVGRLCSQNQGAVLSQRDKKPERELWCVYPKPNLSESLNGISNEDIDSRTHLAPEPADMHVPCRELREV